MRLVVFGLALGAAASLLTGRWMGSLLFGVSALDWTTYSIVAGVLLLVGLLAAVLPARRAVSVDPIIALRSE